MQINFLFFTLSKKPEQLNNTDLSLLMEALTKHGRYDEAKNVYEELLSRSVLPMNRVLKYFSISATLKGDVEFLENLKTKLDQVSVFSIQFKQISS